MTSAKRAHLMLRISSIFYIVFGLALIILASTGILFDANAGLAEKIALYASGGFSLAIVAVIEFVAAGLRAQKKWAWIGAVIIFATYVPSLFLPLGVIGLIALLKKESRETYGVEEAIQAWTGNKEGEKKAD